jgi:hypothetical protein
MAFVAKDLRFDGNRASQWKVDSIGRQVRRKSCNDVIGWPCSMAISSHVHIACVAVGFLA